MSLLKISADELRKSRKSGFKRKAPKKPKRSASVQVLENYISRYNSWVKDAKASAKKIDRKAQLLKMIDKN